jgi:Nif-specific regulatory protein
MLTEQDVVFGICPGAEAEEQQPGAMMVARLGNEPLKIIMADFERELLVRALDKYDGDVALTASKLSLGKTALYDKMRRYNITAKTVRRS